MVADLSRLAVSLATVAALTLTGCGRAGGDDRPPAGQDQGRDKEVIAALRHNIAISVLKSRNTATRIESSAFNVTGNSGSTRLTAKGSLTFGDQFAATAVLTGVGGRSGKAGQLSVRLLGTSVYTEIPVQDRPKHDGKSWFGANLALPDADPDGTVRYLDNIDPVRHLQVLLSASNATAAGPETVDRTTTVRFSATVPLAAYLAGTDPAAKPAATSYLAGHGASEVKIEVWVDTKYQARQCRFTAGDLDLTVTYRDLGKSVVVKAPPLDESIDASAAR